MKKALCNKLAFNVFLIFKTYLMHSLYTVFLDSAESDLSCKQKV